jgi:hypothetical protein
VLLGDLVWVQALLIFILPRLDHFAIRTDKWGALRHIFLLIIGAKLARSELTGGLEYGAWGLIAGSDDGLEHIIWKDKMNGME